jgi:hypothetical protein
MAIRILKAVFSSICLIYSATVFSIPVIVDPSTGLDSVGIDQRFFWDSSVDNVFLWSITEPAPLSSIGTPGSSVAGAFDPFWNILLRQDSVIDLEAIDGFIIGDQFELVVDAAPVSWDKAYSDTSGYFYGSMDDLFLSAGSHTFSLIVTQGGSLGAAWMNFSAASAIDISPPKSTGIDPAQIPVPATPMLIVLGVFGLVWSRKRTHMSAANSSQAIAV